MNSSNATPELILHRGLFTTLDRANPTATAIAIMDGKFSAVGRDHEVLPLAGDVLPLRATVLELRGFATALAGASQPLQAALKDLGATVQQRQIKINLSADVLFDFDKATLRAEAKPALEKVEAVLNAYPTASALIEGHTDGKGNDAYNQKLSEQRAESVRLWLKGNQDHNDDPRLGQKEACCSKRQAEWRG